MIKKDLFLFFCICCENTVVLVWNIFFVFLYNNKLIMKNSIAERIADFLQKHPPFCNLSLLDLITISKECQVLHLEKKQVIFNVNDEAHSFFYVVKDGAVALSVIYDEEQVLIDECDEGDILGLRPFFAKDAYLMTAEASEESLLYAIPIAVFKPYIFENVEVSSFLLESFASNTRNPHDKENKGKLISENVIYNERNDTIQYFKPISYTANPMTANRSDSVKSIAETMTQHKIGSVIIQENQLPIGIITDKDLRSKIATGLFNIEAGAEQIMSVPVITVSANGSVAETQLMMLQHNIGHLCVTSDGTNGSEIIGIISEHDVVVAQANNPGVLVKQIKRAEGAQELKAVRENLSKLIQNALNENIPIAHLCQIVGEINRAITSRAIELSINKIGEQPPVAFAWLNIGSQGRKEQLLLTDQDNALVFADVAEESYDDVKKYFIELADHVTHILNVVGYEFCPADMMASNPLWCKSLKEWNAQYNTWINSPAEKGILMCSIFFDFDFVYGEKELVDSITANILKSVEKNQVFFAYLGRDALKNPAPLGFFRQFLVEKDGEHKDSFDVKSRGLMPLIDAARLLSLNQKITGVNNTLARFKELMALEPQNSATYEACSEAFSVLLKFRTQEGFASDSGGRYLDLNNLTKLDKVKLKNAFHPISDVQEILKIRFQLAYFT
jgi:CBS domain-containing protein